MQSVDLNLLVVLDALLQEGSVSGAAKRLQLTPSAVSRCLGRLRRILGDPLLVRAGRGLVPTSRALELRDESHQLVQSVTEFLSPAVPPLLEDFEAGLTRTFVVRAGPDNAGAFGPAVLREVHDRAPGVVMKFVGDGDHAAEDLRDARLDLVLGGAISATTERIHREAVLTDTAVIVGRQDGAFARACEGRQPTTTDIVNHPYVDRFPASVWYEVLDRHLAEASHRRRVVATAPGFAAAFAMVRSRDLICLSPGYLSGLLRGEDLLTWKCPVELPRLVIELAWHHRNHHDPEHQWLRARVRTAMISVAQEHPHIGRW